MQRFRPDMTLIQDLYAVAYTKPYGKRTYVLREIVLNLGMQFDATCVMSVIDTNRSHKHDRFSVTQDRTEIYNAFQQNTYVKVFQKMEGSKGGKDELLFDGYVYKVDRRVSSDPSSFYVSVDVTLVTAPLIYSKNCAEMAGAMALTNNPAIASGGGPTFYNITEQRRALTEKALEQLINAGSSPDIVKFLCDCVEYLLLPGSGKASNKAGNGWMTDGKPVYTDLRKFISTTHPRAVKLNPSLRAIAGKAAESFIQKITMAVVSSTPVDAIVQLCMHFGIIFSPVFTNNVIRWVGIANLPMKRSADASIVPSDVLSYNYSPTDIPWGKYKNVAVQLSEFSCKPEHLTTAKNAHAGGQEGFILMTAGYNRRGQLVCREFTLRGDAKESELETLGPIHIIQVPSWVIMAAQKEPDEQTRKRLAKTYCRALVRTVYGTGEMFNGKLQLSVAPELITTAKNNIGKVYKLDIKSDAVNPGILYGRLVSVQYRMGALKDLKSNLHLVFDCVRTKNENAVLGVEPSDMLYA